MSCADDLGFSLQLAAFGELPKVVYYFCQIKVVIAGSSCCFPTIYFKLKLELSKPSHSQVGHQQKVGFWPPYRYEGF